MTKYTTNWKHMSKGCWCWTQGELQRKDRGQEEGRPCLGRGTYRSDCFQTAREKLLTGLLLSQFVEKRLDSTAAQYNSLDIVPTISLGLVHAVTARSLLHSALKSQWVWSIIQCR